MRVKFVPDKAKSESQLQNRGPGGPAMIRCMTIKYLERLGVEAVDNTADADIVHGFGADAPGIDLDVLTVFLCAPLNAPEDHPLGWHWINKILKDSMDRSRIVLPSCYYTANQCRQLTKTPLTVIEQGYDPEIFSDTYDTSIWCNRFGSRPIVLWPKVGVDEGHPITPATALAQRCSDIAVVAPLDIKIPDAPPNFYSVGTMLPDAFKSLIAASSVLLGTNIEGGSTAHLEAMHLGVPVLSYQHGGDCENSVGISVPVGDIDALEHGLRKILAEHDTLSQAAKIYARSLSYERIAPRILAIYQRIYEEKHA